MLAKHHNVCSTTESVCVSKQSFKIFSNPWFINCSLSSWDPEHKHANNQHANFLVFCFLFWWAKLKMSLRMPMSIILWIYDYYDSMRITLMTDKACYILVSSPDLSRSFMLISSFGMLTKFVNSKSFSWISKSEIEGGRQLIFLRLSIY